jgi:hypothetical protein
LASSSLSRWPNSRHRSTPSIISTTPSVPTKDSRVGSRH